MSFRNFFYCPFSTFENDLKLRYLSVQVMLSFQLQNRNFYLQKMWIGYHVIITYVAKKFQFLKQREKGSSTWLEPSIFCTIFSLISCSILSMKTSVLQSTDMVYRYITDGGGERFTKKNLFWGLERSLRPFLAKSDIYYNFYFNFSQTLLCTPSQSQKYSFLLGFSHFSHF